MVGPSGSAYLLYVFLLLCAAVSSWIIPNWLRPDGDNRPTDDADVLALLGGGTDRFADAAATRLLTSGALTADRNGLTLDARHAESVIDGDLRALGETPSLRALLDTLKWHGETVEFQAIDNGLLIDHPMRLKLRLWQSLPFLLLLGVWQIGSLLVGFVGSVYPLGILAVLLAAFRFALVDRRTAAGQRVFSLAFDRWQRLTRAVTSEEAALGVALYGTVVLKGSRWEEFHWMRMRQSKEDRSDSGGCSGDGDGGGCGSSGCGGGGCGGGGD